MEIKQSKTKTLKIFIFSLLFVVLGIYIIRWADDYGQPRATLMRISGILSILFFGMTGTLLAGRLLRRGPGVVFMPEGFIDHSSYAGGYLVRWEDVRDIQRMQVVNQKFVSVLLKNPEAYLSGMKGLQRFFSVRNYKSYQTPVHISPVALEADEDTLLRLFIEQWNRYKATQLAG